MKRHTHHIELTPVDSWFFRDGSPFNAGEAGQGHAKSLFPPHPPSIVGVLRASLAQAGGWSGRGSWEQHIMDVLGNGYEDMGTFKLESVMLSRDGEPLYPAPLNVLATPQEQSLSPVTLLTPSPKPTLTDMGAARLPIPQVQARGLKSLEGHWMSGAGFESVLQGNLPGAGTIFAEQELFRHEFRMGLARDAETRTAIPGMLYAPRHVRLARGVSLGVKFSLGEGWEVPEVFGFGGEARLATARACKDWLMPACPRARILETGRATLTLLSAARFEEELIPQQSFPGLPGATLVSACQGKPVKIGGWDFRERIPRALTPFHPAGSVYFVEADSAEVRQRLVDLHDTHIGQQHDQGYGHVILGTWT